MNRRQLLMSGASFLSCAALIGLAGPAVAQTSEEIVIGVLFPMSGANAQVGIDARHAVETAADIVNNSYDLDLPGSAMPRSGWCSPTISPIRKRGGRRPSV